MTIASLCFFMHDFLFIGRESTRNVMCIFFCFGDFFFSQRGKSGALDPYFVLVGC